MAGFELETGTLALVAQLSERQAGHMRAVVDYVEANTTLSDVGGAVMLCLGPRYREGRQTALTGFGQGVAVCDAVTARATETRQSYLDADVAAVDRMRAPAAALGISFPEFQQPTEPVLGAAGGAATPGGTDDEGITPWGRLTPEPLRPAANVVNGVLPRVAGRVHPTTSSVVPDFSVRGAVSLALSRAEDEAWAAADRRHGVPGATSTLRDQFEQAQHRRFAEAYGSGAQATPAGSLTSYTDWSQDRTALRTYQGATQVYSTVGSVRSAWNELEGAQDAARGRDTVVGVAHGEANTDTYDWAR